MLKKGFTLLEVLIVVIIIGILAAIALPQYGSTIEKARSAEAISNIGSVRTSFDRYWYELSAIAASYSAATFAKLDVNDPNNDTNRKYNYVLTDSSTLTAKNYQILGQRIGSEGTYWVKWNQTDNNTGTLYRSSALGGPES